MRAFRSNSTKPVKNESKNVDVAKKALNAELTACVSKNETMDIMCRDFGDEYLYGCKVNNILAMISEDKLVWHLVRTFDDFKIMKLHVCVDLIDLPCMYYQISSCSADYKYFVREYQFGKEVWTEVTLDDERLDDYRADIQENYEGIINFNDPIVMPIEVPVTICAAATRAIPNGLLVRDDSYIPQNPTLQNSDFLPNGTYYGPNWDRLMSYSSAVWQSKMPGAPVHLSLEIQGSSNSERMMTSPTEMLLHMGMIGGNGLLHNDVTIMKPQFQSGKFFPTLYIGCKLKKLTEWEGRNICNMRKNDYYPAANLYSVWVNNEWIDPTPEVMAEIANDFNSIRDRTVQYNADVRIQCKYEIQNGDIKAVGDAPVIRSAKLNVHHYTTLRFKHLRLLEGAQTYTYVRDGYFGTEETRGTEGQTTIRDENENKFNQTDIKINKDFEVESNPGGEYVTPVYPQSVISETDTVKQEEKKENWFKRNIVKPIGKVAQKLKMAYDLADQKWKPIAKSFGLPEELYVAAIKVSFYVGKKLVTYLIANSNSSNTFDVNGNPVGKVTSNYTPISTFQPIIEQLPANAKDVEIVKLDEYITGEARERALIADLGYGQSNDMEIDSGDRIVKINDGKKKSIGGRDYIISSSIGDTGDALSDFFANRQ